MFSTYTLIEKHCNNSTLKNRDKEAIGVGFWGVNALKLALKKSLEMLSSGFPYNLLLL